MKKPTVSRNSQQLQAAIDLELAGRQNPSPDEYFQAVERAARKHGDSIFDRLNPGDMLVRAMVIEPGL